MPKKTPTSPRASALPGPFQATPAALGLPWRLEVTQGGARILRADGQPALATVIDLARDTALRAFGPPAHRHALLEHVVASVNLGEAGALDALDGLANSGAISPRPGDTPGTRQAGDAALAVWMQHRRAGRALTAAEESEFASWFEHAYHEHHGPIARDDQATARHKNTAFAWAQAGYRHALGV